MRLVFRAGKKLFVLPPFVPERLFPVKVLLDAVAVTNVDGRLACQAFDGTVKAVHTPFGHQMHECVESGLVKLDDVDTQGLQFQGLLVQQLGKCHGHFGSLAIVPVGNRVADGHRSRQGEFQLLSGMRAQKPNAFAMHGFFAS